MKFWVKIVVALSIVVVAVFGVWAFFFKENDEKIAYNRVCELVDYKQSLGISERLSDLYNYDYYGLDKSNTLPIDSEDGKKVADIRKDCLNANYILKGDDLAYGSYKMYDERVDEILEYILPYLNGSKTSSKPRKAVTKSVSNYITSLKSMSEALDMVLDTHKGIDGSPASITVLAGNYGEFKTRYRNTLKCASEVITSSIDYINLCVFDGDIKLDTKFAMSDAFAIALNEAMSVETIREFDFSYDAYKIYSVLSAYKDTSIGSLLFNSTYSNYVGYSEYEFLNAYNDMLCSHRDTLNTILTNPFSIKSAMADGKELSEIAEATQNSVIVILNVLGF